MTFELNHKQRDLLLELVDKAKAFSGGSRDIVGATSNTEAMAYFQDRFNTLVEIERVLLGTRPPRS
jgi:hypothetical protein